MVEHDGWLKHYVPVLRARRWLQLIHASLLGYWMRLSVVRADKHFVCLQQVLQHQVPRHHVPEHHHDEGMEAYNWEKQWSVPWTLLQAKASHTLSKVDCCSNDIPEINTYYHDVYSNVTYCTRVTLGSLALRKSKHCLTAYAYRYPLASVADYDRARPHAEMLLGMCYVYCKTGILHRNVFSPLMGSSLSTVNY